MPITAKLLQTFHDKLDHEGADGVVEWLNAVDEAYRRDFRELFEANFGRLEARLDATKAELRHEMGSDLSRLREFITEGFAGLRVEVAQREKSLIRWMFGFWIGSWGILIGALIALHQFGLLAR